MSRLYPRLLPGASSTLWAALRDDPQPTVSAGPPSLADVIFAPTGGTRVTAEDLQAIRNDILGLAHDAGAPGPIDDRGRSTFDLATARYLHARLDMSPGEASQRGVWSYVGLVLLPDVCAWRFPMRKDGYNEDRFRGADLTRHTFARLWLRAHLLHEPSAVDPYGLVDVLGENDMDQVLARRLDVAATPALVRAVVRAHRDDASDLPPGLARDILRDSLKRLLRLTSFLDPDGRSDGELYDLVLRLRGQARAALTSMTVQ